MTYVRSQGQSASPVEPGNMLWLIQRDFLQGKTANAMVAGTQLLERCVRPLAQDIHNNPTELA